MHISRLSRYLAFVVAVSALSNKAIHPFVKHASLFLFVFSVILEVLEGLISLTRPRESTDSDKPLTSIHSLTHASASVDAETTLLSRLDALASLEAYMHEQAANGGGDNDQATGRKLDEFVVRVAGSIQGAFPDVLHASFCLVRKLYLEINRIEIHECMT